MLSQNRASIQRYLRNVFCSVVSNTRQKANSRCQPVEYITGKSSQGRNFEDILGLPAKYNLVFMNLWLDLRGEIHVSTVF